MAFWHILRDVIKYIKYFIPNPGGSWADKHGLISAGRAQTQNRRGVLAACANLILNTVGAVLLSGAHRLLWWTPGSERSSQLHAAARLCKLNAFRKSTSTKGPLQQAWKTDKGAEWEEKTAELAARGISLRNLLTFYKLLGDSVMPSYEPSRHSTNDVVRLAIIPLTAAHSSSYAEQVNQGRKMIPKKMVTHSWSNLFRDLLASVLADALGEHTFEFLARLLSDRAGTELVEQMLLSLGRLDDSYWICAFAVNQHSGICGANPNGNVDPVTLIPHPICDCGKPKMFNKTPPLNSEDGYGGIVRSWEKGSKLWTDKPSRPTSHPDQVSWNATQKDLLEQSHKIRRCCRFSLSRSYTPKFVLRCFTLSY